MNAPSYLEMLLGRIKTLGVIGSGGDFGSFLVERTKEELPFLTVLEFDKFKPSKATLMQSAECDIVVITVPIDTYTRVLREVLPLMRQGAILICVCTVQTPSIEFMRRQTLRRRALFTHPLFGRQSWEDNGRSLRGLEIAICGHTLTPSTYKAAKAVLCHLGLKVQEMDAEEHDRDVMAREQWLTQYGGQLIEDAGFGLNGSNLHTRSAKLFFTAMRIVGKDRRLFWDAYDVNPACEEVAERFEQAVMKMRAERLARKKKRC